MALSDRSRESLLLSFLYASAARSFAGAARLPSSTSAPTAISGGALFSIQAPKEKIEMYSPAFYAACTAGGIASCGLTHMAVTPLNLVKCNMQAYHRELSQQRLAALINPPPPQLHVVHDQPRKMLPDNAANEPEKDTATKKLPVLNPVRRPRGKKSNSKRARRPKASGGKESV